MKKTPLLLLLTLLIAGLSLFVACRKDSSGNHNNNPGTTPDEQVEASLDGRVLDENGVPVKDAGVTSGLATTTTDVNGVFHFKNISMSSRFGFVKVTKQGYFTGSRTVLTNANGGNYVEISLIPRVSKGSFAAGSGGTVTIQGDNTVDFQGGSFVSAASNAAYSGNVNVFATYLDPTDSTLNKHMPGALRGITSDNKETGLQTFGMVGVELEDDAGNKLQIASGKTATIHIAIPASLQGTAPATIPLWYFNDTTGRWIEQGVATREGDSYTGQVSHFSFWNCDAPVGTIQFKLTLKNMQGDALPYTYIRFLSTGYGYGDGMTDSSGYSQGAIIKGQALVLQIIDRCGDIVYTQNIGPAQADLDLGTITVDISQASLSLSGTVVDCTNQPVANGFVSIYLEGLNYRATVANGQFSLQVSRCASSETQLQATAGDYGSNQQGSTSLFSVVSGDKDLGQLIACGTTLDQFISVTMGGKVYSLSAPPDSIYYYNSGGNGNVYAWNLGGTYLGYSFGIPQLAGTGDYSLTGFDMSTVGHTYWPPNDSPISCTVTAYGNVNGFITGTLSGTLVDTLTKSSYPMTGSFKVKRTN